eukprot:506393_1
MICGCCPAMIQLFIPVLLLLFKPIYQRLPQKQRELIDTGIKKCQQMIRNIWKKFGSPDNKKTEWCASCCQTNDNKKTEDCGSCCQTNDTVDHVVKQMIIRRLKGVDHAVKQRKQMNKKINCITILALINE